MTQTSTEALATAYGMYGNRQDEFGYLSAESQAEIVEYCHAVANMMAEARKSIVVTVTAGGFEITQAMIDAEIVETAARRPMRALTPMTTTDPFYTGFHGVSHFA
jgi:hypothetical protein